MHDVDEEDGDGEEGVGGVVVPAIVSYNLCHIERNLNKFGMAKEKEESTKYGRSRDGEKYRR